MSSIPSTAGGAGAGSTANKTAITSTVNPTISSPPTATAATTASPSLVSNSNKSDIKRMVGQYIVHKRIGAGSFATVWKGQHQTSGLIVAIKSINRDKLNVNKKHSDNLSQEISIMQQLTHRNIVQLYEIIQTERHIYLILEYCSGGDLSRLLRKTGPLSESIVQHLSIELMLGLKFLRENKLIHRDLKPQNLLLDNEPVSIDYNSIKSITLKLADFGFARYIEPTALAATLCGCLVKDSIILTSNGNRYCVDDLEAGQNNLNWPKLLNEDGGEQRIKSVYKGITTTIYRINQSNDELASGMINYEVTEQHLLCVRYIGKPVGQFNNNPYQYEIEYRNRSMDYRRITIPIVESRSEAKKLAWKLFDQLDDVAKFGEILKLSPETIVQLPESIRISMLRPYRINIDSIVASNKGNGNSNTSTELDNLKPPASAYTTVQYPGLINIEKIELTEPIGWVGIVVDESRHNVVLSDGTITGNSPLYMAPEILRYQNYDATADLWSVGAIIYEMCTGKAPFNGANHIQLLQRIEAAKELQWPNQLQLSTECKDLVNRLLKRMPAERIKFEEFFNHPFLQKINTIAAVPVPAVNELNTIALTVNVAIPVAAIVNNNTAVLNNIPTVTAEAAALVEESQLPAVSNNPNHNNNNTAVHHNPLTITAVTNSTTGVGTIALPPLAITAVSQVSTPTVAVASPRLSIQNHVQQAHSIVQQQQQQQQQQHYQQQQQQQHQPNSQSPYSTNPNPLTAPSPVNVNGGSLGFNTNTDQLYGNGSGSQPIGTDYILVGDSMRSQQFNQQQQQQQQQAQLQIQPQQQQQQQSHSHPHPHPHHPLLAINYNADPITILQEFTAASKRAFVIGKCGDSAVKTANGGSGSINELSTISALTVLALYIKCIKLFHSCSIELQQFIQFQSQQQQTQSQLNYLDQQKLIQLFDYCIKTAELYNNKALQLKLIINSDNNQLINQSPAVGINTPGSRSARPSISIKPRAYTVDSAPIMPITPASGSGNNPSTPIITLRSSMTITAAHNAISPLALDSNSLNNSPAPSISVSNSTTISIPCAIISLYSWSLDLCNRAAVDELLQQYNPAQKKYQRAFRIIEQLAIETANIYCININQQYQQQRDQNKLNQQMNLLINRINTVRAKIEEQQQQQQQQQLQSQPPQQSSSIITTNPNPTNRIHVQAIRLE